MNNIYVIYSIQIDWHPQIDNPNWGKPIIDGSPWILSGANT